MKKIFFVVLAVLVLQSVLFGGSEETMNVIGSHIYSKKTKMEREIAVAMAEQDAAIKAVKKVCETFVRNDRTVYNEKVLTEYISYTNGYITKIEYGMPEIEELGERMMVSVNAKVTIDKDKIYKDNDLLALYNKIGCPKMFIYVKDKNPNFDSWDIEIVKMKIAKVFMDESIKILVSNDKEYNDAKIEKLAAEKNAKIGIIVSTRYNKDTKKTTLVAEFNNYDLNLVMQGIKSDYTGETKEESIEGAAEKLLYNNIDSLKKDMVDFWMRSMENNKIHFKIKGLEASQEKYIEKKLKETDLFFGRIRNASYIDKITEFDYITQSESKFVAENVIPNIALDGNRKFSMEKYDGKNIELAVTD